jgi:hypothetical protein
MNPIKYNTASAPTLTSRRLSRAFEGEYHPARLWEGGRPHPLPIRFVDGCRGFGKDSSPPSTNRHGAGYLKNLFKVALKTMQARARARPSLPRGLSGLFDVPTLPSSERRPLWKRDGDFSRLCRCLGGITSIHAVNLARLRSCLSRTGTNFIGRAGLRGGLVPTFFC